MGGAAGAAAATDEDALGALGTNVSVVEGLADAGLVHAGGGEYEGTKAALGRAREGGSGGGDGGGDRRRLLGGHRGILRRLVAAGRVEALGHVALAGEHGVPDISTAVQEPAPTPPAALGLRCCKGPGGSTDTGTQRVGGPFSR